MYSTCPKCQYQHSDAERGAAACPGCGLVYEKWLKNLANDPLADLSIDTQTQRAGVSTRLGKFFLQPKPTITRAEVVGYGIVWIALAFWGWNFLSMDFRSAEIMNSWLHNVDLVFHEAGHVLFMPFGRYMMILGGSLFQVLVPLIFVFAFLLANKDAFAASVCLWWAGQSLMDLYL